MTSDPLDEPGTLVSHCTEEDGPADVGLSVTLPGGAVLWAGEITRAAWEDAGEDAASLGDDCGTWLILYDAATRPEVIGKATTREAGFALAHAVADALSQKPASDDEEKRDVTNQTEHEALRLEVEELRRAIATVRDTALEEAENELRRRAREWELAGRGWDTGEWRAAALVVAEMRRRKP